MNVWITVLLVVNISAIIYILLMGYDGLIKLAVSLFRISGLTDLLYNSSNKHRSRVGSIMPISIILPDCDKDPQIVQTVKNLYKLDYPEFEIIAICNGLKGSSLDKLVETFGMIKVEQPIKRSVPMQDVRAVYRSPKKMNLVVINKDGTERHDALNAGVNLSRYPLFVILGKGYRLRDDALTHITQSFARNYRVIAVGSLPRIREKGKLLGLLGSMQEAEYLRIFPAGLAAKLGKRRLSVVPGSFGAFRKINVIKENGFIPSGSETEMVIRLSREYIKHSEDYEFDMLPIPVLTTDPPGSSRELVRQRMQWQADTAMSLWKNKRMLFNPRYGRAGLLDTPYYWFFNVIGPILELVGCITIPLSFAFGIIGIDFFMAFLAVELLFNIVISLSAVVSQEILDGDASNTERAFRRSICAILNNLGYRQIMLLFSFFGLFLPSGRKSRQPR